MQSPSPQLLRALRTILRNSPSRATASHPAITPGAALMRYQPIPLRHLSTTFQRPASGSSSSRTVKQNVNPKLQTHDRGPRSDEDTQTDFRTLDIYNNTPPPATIVDACLSDGFHLNNGLKITGGDGVLLLGGEAFAWRPWSALPSSPLLTKTGALDLSSAQTLGLLSLLHPLPDLLILGTGGQTLPLTKKSREYIASLGVKIDIMDTRNAAASFNLLSTERGTEEVAAAMLPVGWKIR